MIKLDGAKFKVPNKKYPPPGDQRHLDESIGRGSSSKKVNSIYNADTKVEVLKNLEGIEAGKALLNKNANGVGEYLINGRIYQIHQGHWVPVKCPGIYNLNKLEFNAFKIIKSNSDDLNKALNQINRNPKLRGVDKKKLIRYWQRLNK